MLKTTHNPWRDQFWALARVLKCLPSSYADANDHVLQKARELVGGRATNPEDVCPWPDYFGQPIVHGARLKHPIEDDGTPGRTFTAVRLMGAESPSAAWRAVYDDGVVLFLGNQITKGQAVLMGCDKAPPGWRCSRNAGHDGPCAAHEWPPYG